LYLEFEITNSSAKSRVRSFAERQHGRVTWAQLEAINLAGSTLTAWVANGYLRRVLPRVYAVGHSAPSVEADLMAAVLYAGPGAMLSHASAAWWLGLIDEPPRVIHVTTPRRCRSVHGVRVYGRRSRTRVLHRGLPVTCREEAIVDLAATASLRDLRKALANADYQSVLHLDAIDRAIKRGTRGATKLRTALKDHQPKLAWTKSQLEVMLVEICESERIPVPEINTKVKGWEVDAYWPQVKLVVELDGYGNHHTPAQLKRDRRKEMALRSISITVIRYSGDQLRHDRRAVSSELESATRPSAH
jgi:predicted transcriptional regulator of viral defense system